MSDMIERAAAIAAAPWAYASEDVAGVLTELLAALPAAQPAQGEAVAWRIRLAGDDPEEWTLHHNAVDYLDRPAFECQPLYAHPPTPPDSAGELDALVRAAYRAGFESSGEGYNGEYGVDGMLEEDAGWVAKRDRAITALRAKGVR